MFSVLQVDIYLTWALAIVCYQFFLWARLETAHIMWLGMAGELAGGRPHRFPHNNFSSVYRILTKLGHMIPLWKGENPIYIDGHILWCTHFLFHINLLLYNHYSNRQNLKWIVFTLLGDYI